MAARRRTRPGTFLSLPHHPEESVILQFHLSQVWCLPHSVVFFLKLTSFYFLILAVLNSAPVLFPESYFFPFILKGGMLQVLCGHTAGVSFEGDLWNPFSQISVIHCLILVAVRHFGIYHFFSPLKKKVLSPDIFLAAKITPDGMFCIGKKQQNFSHFLHELFSSFKFWWSY